MATCAYCGKRLGLVEYFRKRGLRFCSKAHKKAWEHAERERERGSRFLAWLLPALQWKSGP